MQDTNLETLQPSTEELSPLKSLWGQFLEEMNDTDVIEKDYGFISFKIEEGVCLVFDFFIAQPFRNGSYRRTLMLELHELCRFRGVSVVTGKVDLGLKDSTRTLAFWLTMDATAYKAEANQVYFMKRL